MSRKTEKPFILTAHAAQRLRERSRIPDEAALNALMQLGFAPNYPLDADTGAWLFWSPDDDWGYLAIYNRHTREIISLMRAYELRNGRFIGALYWECDLYRKLNLPGQRKIGHAEVRRSDVRYCLHLAGLPVPPELQRQEETKAQGLVYKLRWQSLDGRTRTKTLLKERAIESAHIDTPSPLALEKAREILSAQPLSYVSARLEATLLGKKRDLRFAPLLKDWELDPKTLEPLAERAV